MLELAVVFIVIGLLLVLLGAFAPIPAGGTVAQVGWFLAVVGVILLIVALLLGSVDVDLGDGEGRASVP